MSQLLPVGLIISTDSASEAEQGLADFLGIPLIGESEDRSAYGFCLQFLPKGLALHDLDATAAKPTIVDFSSSQLESRASDSLSQQNLIKALGVKKYPHPTVLDGMAGLGKDAYLMAMAGCQVHMLEKSKLVYSLLNDGLVRLQQLDFESLGRGSLNLEFGDFLDARPAAQQYDVVYLDPMYQSSNRKSKAKRDIERLQRLLGKEENEDSLLAHGLLLAKRRVIVKRAKNAPLFAAKKPDFNYKGSSARFDVYLTA